ncbi:PulJ/GspJ family protein [Oceanithermus sp.]
MKRAHGFSLIEAMIAIAILGILLAAILQPLGSLFLMSSSSRDLLERTTQAQQVVERVMREWQDPSKFDQACLDLDANPLPSNVTVRSRPLDLQAQPLAGYAVVVSCPQSPSPAALRRLTVVVSGEDGPDAEIVVDVVKP